MTTGVNTAGRAAADKAVLRTSVRRREMTSRILFLRHASVRPEGTAAAIRRRTCGYLWIYYTAAPRCLQGEFHVYARVLTFAAASEPWRTSGISTFAAYEICGLSLPSSALGTSGKSRGHHSRDLRSNRERRGPRRTGARR